MRCSTWKGPGPRRASASAAGPGSAGWASVSPVGPRSNTAMSALITAPRWIFGTGSAEHAGVGPGRRRHVRHRDIGALHARHAVRVARQAHRVRLPLGERGQVLDEEDRQGIARTEERRAPAQLLALRRAPPAVADLAHVHAALAHRGHVGGQIVALQRHDPEAAALVEVLGEARVRAAGHDRAPVADAQDLQIVLVVEGDRVVGRPAGVRAAGIDGEAEPRVGLDPLGQVRHADHHVVDAGQHARVP